MNTNETRTETGAYNTVMTDLPPHWAQMVQAAWIAMDARMRARLEDARRRRALRAALIRAFSVSADQAHRELSLMMTEHDSRRVVERGFADMQRRLREAGAHQASFAGVRAALRPELELEPYELQGSEETLLVIQSLLLLLPLEHRRGATSTSAVEGGRLRLKAMNLKEDTLRTLWKETVQRQANLQRALLEPVQGEEGLAARFIALERARRLVEAALGCSRPRAELVPLE